MGAGPPASEAIRRPFQDGFLGSVAALFFVSESRTRVNIFKDNWIQKGQF